MFLAILKSSSSLSYRTYLVFFVVFTLGLADGGTYESTQYKQRIDSNDRIDLSIFGRRIFKNPVPFNPSRSYSYSSDNPEELGPYFEGDILVRNGVVGESYRWPNAVVPYEIRGHFTSSEQTVLGNAINEFHRKTCVRFRPRKSLIDRDYISIVSGKTGCWSSIGRLGGRQELNLQSNLCLFKHGTPIHELMHAIGFFHEQNRHERDSYVRVLIENVIPDMKHNFAKYNSRISYGYGVPYDYASVMHYSSRSFSVNGKPTILPLYNTPASRRMGQRNGFSNGDITKINAMYRCRKKERTLAAGALLQLIRVITGTTVSPINKNTPTTTRSRYGYP